MSSIQPSLPSSYNVFQQEETQIVNRFFKTMCDSIQSDFNQYKETTYASHIKNTKECILQAKEHLNHQSKVLILGPGQIEPYQNLTEFFQEIVLVDYVPTEITKTLKDKVQFIQYDLSRGMVEQAKNCIASARFKNLSQQDFIESLIQFFSQAKLNDLSINQSLGQADYVISSFVITQLANQITLYIEQRMQQLYPSLSFEEDHELFESLNKSEETFRQKMQEQHLIDLQKLSTPDGVVYLADAVKGIRTSEKESSTFQMIQPNTLKKIESMFTTLKTDNWNWLSAPEGSFQENAKQKVTFEIQAYLLKNTSY